MKPTPYELAMVANQLVQLSRIMYPFDKSQEERAAEHGWSSVSRTIDAFPDALLVLEKAERYLRHIPAAPMPGNQGAGDKR